MYTLYVTLEVNIILIVLVTRRNLHSVHANSKAILATHCAWNHDSFDFINCVLYFKCVFVTIIDDHNKLIDAPIKLFDIEKI